MIGAAFIIIPLFLAGAFPKDHPSMPSGGIDMPNVMYALETTAVHGIFPIMVLIDFFTYKDKEHSQRLSHKQYAQMTIYPIFYFVFVTVFGHITKEYPYPFLDPAIFGMSVIGYSILTGTTMAGIGILLFK